MSDDFLQYYDNELRYMKELAGEFAQAHPKVAGRLRISREAVEDPHVERLIEAFAFLNARIRMKLDDMFPELTDGLLSMLYPQFIEPTPSAMIVEMTPDEALDAPQTIGRGLEFDTSEVEGGSCRYRTAYDVRLAPIRLVSAQIFRRPLPGPAIAGIEGAQGCLRLRLECLKDDVTFTDLGVEALRFHIAAESRLANILLEVIGNNTIAVALCDDERDPAPVKIGKENIRLVGFGKEEQLLASALGGGHAFNLISDFFAFPQKFMFFDVTGLEAKTLKRSGGNLDIYLYFQSLPDLIERDVGADNFRLFCTPAVNAFRLAAEPLRLDARRPEYRIIPDARRESGIEALRVERVVISEGTDEPFEVAPWFSLAREDGDAALYWQAIRRPSFGPGGGDDVFLTFAHADPGRWLESAAVASIDLLCVNRNLPSRLPFGGGQPALSIGEGGEGVAALRCITAPTPTLRPQRDRDAGWRLVSQLSLNHLSLTEGGRGADALREMLHLHDRTRTPESRAAIAMVREVESRPATVRAPQSGRLAFCSGVDVRLLLDDSRFSGSGGFLLSSILDCFLARYCAVNSFSRLQVDLWKERAILARFPARAGDLALT